MLSRYITLTLFILCIHKVYEMVKLVPFLFKLVTGFKLEKQRVFSVYFLTAVLPFEMLGSLSREFSWILYNLRSLSEDNALGVVTMHYPQSYHFRWPSRLR